MRYQFLLGSRAQDPIAVRNLALEIGFDGIELGLQPEETPRRLRQYEQLCEGDWVKVVHAATTNFDLKAFRDALERAIDYAQSFNATVVNIHPVALKFGGRAGVRQCYDVARELELQHQCVVAIELLPKAKRHWKKRHWDQRAHKNPQGWLKYLHDSQACGTFDLSHAATFDLDLARYVEALGERLAHIHVSDYRPGLTKREPGQQHLLLGKGVIEFSSFFRALCKLPFGDRTMYITLEPRNQLNWRDHQAALRRNLELLRHFTRTDLRMDSRV